MNLQTNFVGLLVGVLTLLSMNTAQGECFDAWAPRMAQFEIASLGYDELPQGHTSTVMTRLDVDQITDMPRMYYKGDHHVHPLQVARRLMELVAGYRSTGEDFYLSKAEEMAGWYLDYAHRQDGALYFAYPFDFDLHQYSGDTMIAPWYSGMAQGEALSAFVRLYQTTRDKKYKDAADQIFRGFLNLKNCGSEPWFAHVDTAGYYWVEEYPMPHAAHTLNGFMFAVFGIHEYWQIDRNPLAERVLKASLTTLKERIQDFRNPEGVSYYCLKHRMRNPVYHHTHIELLAGIGAVSGDAFFADMAEKLEWDIQQTSRVGRATAKYFALASYLFHKYLLD